MKKLLLLVLLAITSFNGYGQTKSDIFGTAPITWLGLDFTQLKFIGDAAQFKDAGTVTSKDMRSKYFTAWNDLIVKEPKKYAVADAVHRDNVTYATEVTQNANDNSAAEYFTQKEDDYQRLNEDAINKLVTGYNFKGKTGIGLLFFVEGMSKDKAEASMWVTFVDMGTKKMLLTQRMTGSAGGFGFRNYWAKTFSNVLQDVEHDFNKRKK